MTSLPGPRFSSRHPTMKPYFLYNESTLIFLVHCLYKSVTEKTSHSNYILVYQWFIYNTTDLSEKPFLLLCHRRRWQWLIVSDPPIVSLRLGSTLNADDIKEGDDVYFECHVRANPHWRRLTWLQDVSDFIF